MNIKLRTNYNVLLFHHIDAVSKWDKYVSDHHRADFEENFSISEEILELLEGYSKLRKDFGWTSESDLFEWALEGFDKESKFKALLEYVRAFEKVIDRDGTTVEQKLLEILPRIEEKLSDLEEELSKHRSKIDKAVDIYSEIFTKGTGKDITCYIAHTPTPEFSQGGANGESIYTEIPPQKQINIVKASVIYHEALHKVLRPRRTLQSLLCKESAALLDPLHGFSWAGADDYLDEVIVHILSNRLILEENVDKKINYYAGNDNSEEKHYMNLWKGIKHFEGVILSQLDSPSDSDEFLKKLIARLLKFLKEEGLEF